MENSLQNEDLNKTSDLMIEETVTEDKNNSDNVLFSESSVNPWLIRNSLSIVFIGL